MRNGLSGALMIIGYLFMIAAFFFDLYCAFTLFGFLGIVVGIFIFPVLMAAIPFYMGFKFGVWLSMILTGIGVIILLIGVFVSKD